MEALGWAGGCRSACVEMWRGWGWRINTKRLPTAPPPPTLEMRGAGTCRACDDAKEVGLDAWLGWRVSECQSANA